MGKMGGNHTVLNHCFQHLYDDLNAKLVEVVLLLGNVLATMMIKIGGIGRYEFSPASILPSHRSQGRPATAPICAE